MVNFVLCIFYKKKTGKNKNSAGKMVAGLRTGQEKPSKMSRGIVIGGAATSETSPVAKDF